MEILKIIALTLFIKKLFLIFQSKIMKCGFEINLIK